MRDGSCSSRRSTFDIGRASRCSRSYDTWTSDISHSHFRARICASAPDFSQLAVYLVPDSFAAVDNTLQRTEFSVPPRNAIPSPEGRFVFKEVVPWDYRIVVAPPVTQTTGPLPALRRVYLKAVLHQNRDVSAAGMAVGTGFDGELDVRLAFDSGGLDGRVLDPNPSGGDSARIVLAPDSRQRIDRYFAVIPSATGRFQFTGVPPGGYKLFALKDAPTGAWYDPDFLREYEERAAVIRIEPGAAEYLEVGWSP